MPIYKGAKQITKVYQGETEIDKVYRGASKVYGADKGTEITVSGNPLVLTNVAKEKALDTLEINGRTEQVQLQGYNLFDKNAQPLDRQSVIIEFTDNGLRAIKKYATQWANIRYKICDVDGNGGKRVSVSYSPSIIGNATLELSNTAGYCFLGYADQDGNNRVTVGKSFTIDANKYAGKMIILWIYPDNSKVGEIGDGTEYTNFMVGFGLNNPPYEPYCGGIPSPNPDYPQEIKNVGSVEVVQSGKNLVDNEEFYNVNNWEYLSYGTYAYNIGKLQAGETYTVSFAKNTTHNVYMHIQAKKGDNTTTISPNPYQGTVNNTPVTFTATDNDYYRFWFYCGVTNRQDLQKELQDFSNVQIEYGTVATDYEPYRPIHTATIDGIELTKWDKVVKRNGVWGVSKYSVKWDNFDSENITMESLPQGNRFAFNRYSNLGLAIPRTERNDNYFMSNLYYSQDITRNADKSFSASASAPRMWIFDNDINSVADFKQKAKERGLIIIFRTLDEQAFIPLSSAIQDQLNALQIYKPTTIVSNNAECELSAKYWCYLDNAEAMLTSLYQNDLSEVLK